MPGKKGHICIDTRDMERALAYYKRQGIEIDTEHCFYDDKGVLKVAFLKKLSAAFLFICIVNK